MTKTKDRAYWQQYADEFRKLLAESRQVLEPQEYERTLTVLINVAMDERVANAVRLHEPPVATPAN